MITRDYTIRTSRFVYLHSWQCLSGLPETSTVLSALVAMPIWTPRYLLCPSCSRGNVYLDSQTPPLHFLQSWQCVSGLPDTSSALPAVLQWQCLSGLPDTSSALPAVVAMSIWTPRHLLCTSCSRGNVYLDSQTPPMWTPKLSSVVSLDSFSALRGMLCELTQGS